MKYHRLVRLGGCYSRVDNVEVGCYLSLEDVRLVNLSLVIIPGLIA